MVSFVLYEDRYDLNGTGNGKPNHGLIFHLLPSGTHGFTGLRVFNVWRGWLSYKEGKGHELPTIAQSALFFALRLVLSCIASQYYLGRINELSSCLRTLPYDFKL